MTSEEIVKKMMQALVVIALIICITGTVYYIYFNRFFEALPFIIGVVLSTIINILRINMLKSVVEKAVDMENGKTAGNYIRLQYLLRLLIVGVVLVAAAIIGTRTGNVSLLWGAVFGILSMQAAAYSLKFTYKQPTEKSTETEEPVKTNETPND